MNDIMMQLLKEGIDLATLKEQLEIYNAEIKAKVEMDKDFESKVENCLASMSKVQAVIANFNTIDEMSNETFTTIYPDLINYLQFRMEHGDQNSCCEHDHDEDCCDMDDFLEDDDLLYFSPEDFPSLEEIDLEDFRLDMEDLKAIVNEGFNEDENTTPEEIQSQKEIIGVIERLQKALSSVESMDELDQETIEALRPDYDLFNQYASVIMNLIGEEFDDEEEDYDDDLVCIECDELSPSHND